MVNKPFKDKLFLTQAPAATIFIRLMAGGVFLSEGIQKFLFPDMLGVGRFMKIGIFTPGLTAPFVGIVEIVFGFLLLIGLFTRLAAVVLFINISTAILTTKIPIFIKSGFWSMMHESRTDFSMFLGLLFLLCAASMNFLNLPLLNRESIIWVKK